MNFLIADVILFVLFVYWLAGALHKRFEEDDADRIDDRYSYEAWHTRGPGACGGKAWTFIDDPRLHVKSSRAILPDGSHPLPCSVPVCGNCGGVVHLGSQSLTLRKIDKIGE